MYGLNILCEISKVIFEISHKTLNTYTANMHFTVLYVCVWVTKSLNCDVFSLGETDPRSVISRTWFLYYGKFWRFSFQRRVRGYCKIDFAFCMCDASTITSQTFLLVTVQNIYSLTFKHYRKCNQDVVRILVISQRRNWIQIVKNWPTSNIKWTAILFCNIPSPIAFDKPLKYSLLISV